MSWCLERWCIDRLTYHSTISPMRPCGAHTGETHVQQASIETHVTVGLELSPAGLGERRCEVQLKRD